MTSLASVDLPDPETPVSAVKAPIGRIDGNVFEVVCVRSRHGQEAMENASGRFLGSSGMVERLPLR